MPGFGKVGGVLGGEVDVAELEDELDAAVPEFFFEVDEDGGVVAAG